MTFDDDKAKAEALNNYRQKQTEKNRRNSAKLRLSNGQGRALKANEMNPSVY